MRERYANIFLLLFTWVLLLLIGGYDRFGWNHPVQLPWVLRINQPGLFPNDPLVDATRYNCSPHWYAVAFLSRYVPLDNLLLVLYILSKLLLVIAAYSFATALVPSLPAVGLAGALVFALQPKPLIGGGTIVRPYYEHSSLAIAVLLFAAAAFVRKKHVFWAVLTGLVFYLNIIYAVAALLYFGAAWLGVEPLRNPPSKWTRALLLMFVISLPSLWWATLNAHQTVEDWNTWIAVIYATQGYHVFPLTWSASSIVLATLFLVVVVVLSLVLRRQAYLCARLSLVWAGVFLFWVSLAFGAGYFVRSRLLVSFQPVRATDFWFASSGIIIVCLARVGLEQALRKEHSLKVIFCALVWGFSFALWRLLCIKEYPPAIIQAAILLSAAPLTVWYFRPRLHFAIDASTLSRILLYEYVALVAVIGMIAAYQRGSVLVNPGTPEYVPIAQWAKRHTPPTDSFLVPLEWSHFRVLSERAVFVLKRDEAVTLPAPSYIKHWVSRLRILGLDIVSLAEPALRKRFFRGELHKSIYNNSSLWKAVYQQLSEETVKRVEQEFGVDYWVVNANRATRFPEVFRYRGWKVVRISQGAQSPLSSPLPHPSPDATARGDSPTRAGPPVKSR